MSRNESDSADMNYQMDQYVDASLELAGFRCVSSGQREGIKQYYIFAKSIMAPLLNFEIPGEGQ